MMCAFSWQQNGGESKGIGKNEGKEKLTNEQLRFLHMSRRMCSAELWGHHAMRDVQRGGRPRSVGPRRCNH